MLNITNIDNCNFSLSGTIGSGLKVYYKKGFFAKACEPVYNETYGRINIQDKTERIISRTPVNQVSLDNVIYATAQEFVTAFNNMIGECCCVQVEPTTTELPLALELTWDNILNVPVADASSVSDWNTFFDLPTNGNPFTSVEINGNVISLIGGSNITVVNGLIIIDETSTFINFGANENLISINDSGCIVSVGTYTFLQCVNLVSVNLPALTSASEFCFAYCPMLNTFTAPELSDLGDSCFEGCESLQEIELLSLVNIGTGCFSDCVGLTSCNFPLLTELSDGAFSSCTLLTDVTLPLITITGDRAFTRCSSLQTISLPSLISLGYDSFNECSSLINVSLPLCETIYYDAFYLCTSLEEISLPSLITGESGLFYGCTNLVNISMPVVTSLGDNATAPVFEGISGNTITLTIPHAIESDDDIVYLKANNTVTVVYSD